MANDVRVPSAEASSIQSKEAQRYRPERAIDAMLREDSGIAIEATELTETQVVEPEAVPLTPDAEQSATGPCPRFLAGRGSVLQGIIWSEVLSRPLCRRRGR